MTTTSMAPSARLLVTVLMVLSTRCCAVIDRLCDNTLRKGPVDFFKFAGSSLGNVAAVFTHEHEDRSKDRFLSILGGCSQPQLLPKMDCCDIL